MIKGRVVDPIIKSRVVDPIIKSRVVDPIIKSRVVDPIIKSRVGDPIINSRVVDPIIKSRVVDPLTSLTQPHLCACPNPALLFNNLRREVQIVLFVDHHSFKLYLHHCYKWLTYHSVLFEG